MTQFNYTVFSASRTQVPVEVKLPSGRPGTAMEDVLMVQLVPTDHAEAGTVKLIISEDLDDAEVLFHVGAELVATIAAKGE